MPTGVRVDWASIDDLGISPDEEIAERIGVTREQVAVHRRDICRYSLGPAKIDWSAQPLGKIPDPVLAQQLGIHTTSVKGARIRRGIPPAVVRRANVDIPIDLFEKIHERNPDIPFHLAVLLELQKASSSW